MSLKGNIEFIVRGNIDGVDITPNSIPLSTLSNFTTDITDLLKSIQEEKKDEKIVSPYTKEKKKYNNWVYIVVYAVIILMIVIAVFWSVKQVTINRSVTDTISYRR